MPSAYLAVHTAAGTSPDVKAAIDELPEVTEAHVVAGNYDLIVELEAEETADLLPIVTRQIQDIEGVGASRTYIVLD
ncbi:MAG: Lrp/AsnC family transcriptional regulator [Halodesulfurarchaeum sp.]